MTEVREGGLFTKAELREAFPSIEQIDRRMRDLRAEGWVILTNREDASLNPDELRLDRVGGSVWDRSYKSRQRRGLTQTQRRAALARDNYTCTRCGVRAGEPYPDDELAIARLVVKAESGGVSVCERCAKGSDSTPRPIAPILDAYANLSQSEQARLGEWIANGRRTFSAEETLWARISALGPETLHALRIQLGAD